MSARPQISIFFLDVNALFVVPSHACLSAQAFLSDVRVVVWVLEGLDKNKRSVFCRVPDHRAEVYKEPLWNARVCALV